MPQTFEQANSWQVRDEVLDYVSRDLLGPWDGPEETWDSEANPGMPQDPGERYLIGKLGPKKADTTEVDSVDLDLGATVSQDPEIPDLINPRTLGKLWVSSMGLSFQLDDHPDAPERLVVEIDAGRYAADGERTSEKGGRLRPKVREPLRWRVELDLTRGDHRLGLEPPIVNRDPQDPEVEHRTDSTVTDQADPDGIALSCQLRRHRGRRVVRLMLINDQAEEVTPKYRNWLFQAMITVTALDGAAAIFAPTGEADHPHRDPEEAHLHLL